MTKSELERDLAQQIKYAGLPEPVREFRFHDTRKWQFDFCWPDRRVAAECEGGVWVRGRHTRGQGFINDCYKYNAAAALGWYVLRFPARLIENGEAISCLEIVLRVPDAG